MVYVCHLITPVLTVFVLGLTFIPVVDRAIIEATGRLGAIVTRLFVVFLSVYIIQLLVDRNCEVRHCSRNSLVRSTGGLAVSIPTKLSLDEDLADPEVEEETRSAE